MNPSKAQKELEAGAKLFEQSDKPRVVVFGSARTEEFSRRFEQVRRLGSNLANAGYDVVTGGGPGMMHAANAGAGEPNSFAVGITLPMEQRFNPTMEGSSRSLLCKYFATRKVLFLKGISAVIMTPGGFGTMDEFFETLTLIQCGSAPRVPIILLDNHTEPFWHPVVSLCVHMADQGMISPEDLDLIAVTSEEDNVVELIKDFS